MAIKTVQEESLTAIGDAIRAKAGGQEPLEFPTGMVKAIEGIEAKPVMEPIVLTGEQRYGCAGPLNSAYIYLYGDNITTDTITTASYMFQRYGLDRVPFSINMKKTVSQDMSYMFQYSRQLREVPTINNAYPSSCQSFFAFCEMLKEIPDNYGEDWNWDRMNTYAYAYRNNVFSSCFSLRKVPKSFIEGLGYGTGSSSTIYSSCFYMCRSLDEIKDFPCWGAKALTSNVFAAFVEGCSRLKALTFAVNEDGSAKTVEWKNQWITLSFNAKDTVGYTSASGRLDILGYNSGITADKEVIDDETYQRLKNDPDWFSCLEAYSRYNHDSAVETINSLPDCSAYLATAGGTNTIKFKGDAGSATDGGAINTLTAEEIAVATAKGWTVSLV